MARENRYRERFEVHRLTDEPVVRIERRVAARRFPLEAGDVRLRGGIRFRLEFKGTPERVQVRGRFHTSIELRCDRCLEVFTKPLAGRFRSLYMPAESMPQRSYRIRDPEDTLISPYRKNVIPLEELIREQVLLKIPIKVVCRAECRGICPVCGKFSGGQGCDCQAEEPDPRWEPLREILGSLS